MKIYSFISYLVVSLSIMMVKTAENPSSNKKANAVNATADEDGLRHIYLSTFKKKYGSRVCEFMKKLYQIDAKDKTPCSFDETSERIKPLLRPRHEFVKVFDEKGIEKIENLEDLVLKIIDAKNEWYILHQLFGNMLKRSVGNNLNEENEIIKKLCFVLQKMFSYSIDSTKAIYSFWQVHIPISSTNINEHVKKEFISKTKDLELKFLENIESSMSFLKTQKFICYGKLEKLKSLLRNLNYNITSLSLNCYEFFLKKKHSEDDRKKFDYDLQYFLFLFRDYISHECCIYDGIQSTVQKLPTS